MAYPAIYYAPPPHQLPAHLKVYGISTAITPFFFYGVHPFVFHAGRNHSHRAARSCASTLVCETSDEDNSVTGTWTRNRTDRPNLPRRSADMLKEVLGS